MFFENKMHTYRMKIARQQRIKYHEEQHQNESPVGHETHRNHKANMTFGRSEALPADGAYADRRIHKSSSKSKSYEDRQIANLAAKGIHLPEFQSDTNIAKNREMLKRYSLFASSKSTREAKNSPGEPLDEQLENEIEAEGSVNQIKIVPPKQKSTSQDPTLLQIKNE
jgi:hypothetical protein